MSPLTDTQRYLATATGVNFVVTSGAGCGKTRVLVARYLHLLEEEPNLPLSDVAAITFTEKAAAQMRDRIRNACLAHLEEARRGRDPARFRLWLERYRQVDTAPITTIHGFCAGLLRSWPVEADVDPGFTTLDETAAALLRRDVVRATLERLVEAEDAHLLAVLEHFRLEELEDLLDEMLAGDRAALERVARPALARSDEELLADLRRRLDEATMAALVHLADSERVRRHEATLRAVRGDPGDRREQCRQEALAHLSALRRARTAERARAAAEALAGLNLQGGTPRNWPAAEDFEAVKEAITALREVFKKPLANLPAFDEPTERAHLAVARAMAGVVEKAIEAYETAKREVSALDFEDLQLRARDLLRDHPRVRDECRRRFRAILVDELQDTNFLQFEIVELLATEPGSPPGDDRARLRPGALFAVGDPKQSIYRFRGAEVEVFEHGRRRVGREGQRALEESFRLPPGMAALVDRLFASRLGPTYEPTRGVAPQVNTTTADVIHLVHESGEGLAAAEGQAAEATAAAERIRRLVEEKAVEVRDPETGAVRPVRWGDVAILLRRFSYLHLWEEALEAAAIPYYVVAGHGFYKQQEVLDVVHLLRVLADPEDDLALAGLLRSPFFAVSDEGLLRLRQAAPTLHEALPRVAEIPNLEAGDLAGLRRAADLLPRWAALKDRLPPAEFLDRVVFDSGYAAAVVGRFGGARAFANLRRMVDLARQFDPVRPASGRWGLWSLGDFLEFVTDMLRSQMRAEQAPVEVPGADAVRIMTIHKAKGLEFPVVVVPDLGHVQNQPQERCFVHPTTGLALRLDVENAGQHRPAAYALARREEETAQAAEALRLFYVAVTRARDYLVLLSHARLRGRRDKTARPSWFDVLRDGLGGSLLAAEPPAPGEEEVEVSPETVVRVTVRPPAGAGAMRPVAPAAPTAQPGSRGRRRAGPRDLFEAGRVRWDVFEARAAVGSPEARERVRRAEGPRLPSRPPPTVAATALADYRRCPRLYWWTHVAGLEVSEPPPSEGLPPAVWGTLCHRALEAALGGADEAEAAATALRDLPPGLVPGRTTAWRTAPEGSSASPTGRDLGATEALAARLAGVVARLKNSPLGRRIAAAPPESVLREVPFVLALGGTAVLGTVDLLFRGPEGWELVDYKTAAPPPSPDAPDALAYDLQLGLYAAAVARWLGEAPARWTAYFLGTGTAWEQAVTPEYLTGVAQCAKKILAAIASERYDASEGPPCEACRVRSACLAATPRGHEPERGDRRCPTTSPS